MMSSFFLQVFLLFFFLLKEQFGAFFLYYAHLSLKHLFVFVRKHFVVCRVAASLKICFHVSFSFGKVKFVKDCFEVIYFAFLRMLVAVCDFFHPFYYFAFAFIYFFQCGSFRTF